MIDLTGRHALVTGGSRGIGAATAVLMANAGARVTIVYRRDRAAAKRVEGAIGAFERPFFSIPRDMGTAKGVSEAVREAEFRLGPIDILVCNAGIWERAPLEQMSDQDWQRTLDTNLKSAFLACRAVAPSMKERGGGAVILVSSTAGQRGEPFYSHYAASKGGMIAFTKSLAAELGPHGIRVNCVAPGWVRTDMTRDVLNDPARQEAIVRGSPLGRLAVPDDVAGPILFLASGLAMHVHGEVLNVNGGSVLCG